MNKLEELKKEFDAKFGFNEDSVYSRNFKKEINGG